MDRSYNVILNFNSFIVISSKDQLQHFFLVLLSSILFYSPDLFKMITSFYFSLSYSFFLSSYFCDLDLLLSNLGLLSGKVTAFSSSKGVK